jgi:GT2 family glycosyltransferase
MLAIVVLQYGREDDTVACLQSIARAIDGQAVRVIVVDNASPGESVATLRSWMAGSLPVAPRSAHDVLAHHWWPLSGADDQWYELDSNSRDIRTTARWTLFRAAENRGFAAGMNCGLRVALSDPAVSAVWLLNNDTVVAPDAVRVITAALSEAAESVGQFGTTVCYYDRPMIVQSVGWCAWNSWLATSHRLHDGASEAQRLTRTPTMPGYVYGASWIIRASALRDVGLLSEEGFLYGEELDWSCRAADRWESGLIAAAKVWHREGATIGGGAAWRVSRSELADLCGIAARLRLTRRFFPKRLPAVYSSLFGAAFNRLRRGDSRRARAVVRLVLAGGLPSPRPVVRAVGNTPVALSSTELK